ncbi:nicotinamide mononucleotide transporter [Patiriisocius marinistellae]|uniref:Nicotinamide riboside transporter PnuC n=1 Tax=Patiriisocius marinistellae TaxID=2494560 RepID=A0A5J4FU57_9FLAO|nr:nicotinamide riboside transporter PnuC [Patiriisocius marinistellae]GEQ84608.1 nicotinamide mononucleotide transporter [Patiriisocius marinistellae]
MSLIFDFLFGQYAEYETYQIVLESIAVFFGLISAIFSWRNSIWVYPTGIISTSIFVYLLWQWGLLGDLIIQGYYFIMSIYGWYIWTRKVAPEKHTPITNATLKDHKTALLISGVALLGVFVVYTIFDKWNSWTAYVDTLTTAIFFAGMWMLAKRKVANWMYLLAGNIISVPLYFYKGYTLSSLLYIIFIGISILGYRAWKKHLNSDQVIA